VSDFIKRDPLSPSFIIYNRTETLRKIEVFRAKLPWISLFYALKANPIDPLLRDVVGAGAGVDCASKAEIQEALNVGMILKIQFRPTQKSAYLFKSCQR
jgi:ornithine decarboxylase